jgi:hypothetical protein
MICRAAVTLLALNPTAFDAMISGVAEDAS